MSYGSTIAVSDAEDECREQNAAEIARIAAELVAADDMSRDMALSKAAKYIEYCIKAERDETGVIATLEEAQKPQASRAAPNEQVKKIADELMDKAREKASSL